VVTCRDLKTGAAASLAELNQAQARVRSLAAAMASAGPPTRAMAKELDDARTAASGHALATVVIERHDGDRHNYSADERERFQGVHAYWHSGPNDKRETIRVGCEDNSNLKTLPETYPSAGEAKDAAAAEWRRLQRGEATMSYSLALGRPDIIPESPVTVSGFKPEIDAIEWLVMRSTHTLDHAGLNTSLELETRKHRDGSEDASEEAIPS
jgi:phage protein D